MAWTLEDDFMNEMEVLLLDTTHNEGQDNFLYHYAIGNIKQKQFSTNRLLQIRGALAAAAGTFTSLCDEEIILLHLQDEQKQKEYTIGYIDLKEILFLIIFPSKIPHNIIQYYTKSTCDFLLSVFGYPGIKLKAWQQHCQKEQEEEPKTTLVFALDALLEEIFERIQSDLTFKSLSLQFAFDGANASLNLPLSLMKRLVSSDIDILGTDKLTKKNHEDFEFIGRCILVDGLLVVSSMPVEFRKLFTQWFSLQYKGQSFTQVALKHTRSKEDSLRHQWFRLYPYQTAYHANVHPNLFFLSTCCDTLQVLNLYKYTCSSALTLPNVHLDKEMQLMDTLVSTLIEKVHLLSTMNDYKNQISQELLSTDDQIVLIWDTTRHVVLSLLPSNQFVYKNHMLQALLSHLGTHHPSSRRTPNSNTASTGGLDFESNPLIYVPKSDTDIDGQDISQQGGEVFRSSVNSSISTKQQDTCILLRVPLLSSSSTQCVWICQKKSNGFEYLIASMTPFKGNNIQSSWTKLSTYSINSSNSSKQDE